jgi:putative ABC transport system permease protein
MIPVKYNYRNLVVRKTTTIAAAFGLALVVFVFAAAQMLGNGIKKTLGRSAGAENAIVLRRGSSAEMESGIEENQVNWCSPRPRRSAHRRSRPASARSWSSS